MRASTYNFRFSWILSLWLCACCGASECPLEVTPARVVVKYGDPVLANCTTTVEHMGMGWEASQGSTKMVKNVSSVVWRVANLTHWGIKPMCFANFQTSQCDKVLNITVYKHPDSVSLKRHSNHTGPIEEGRQYKLVCEIQNVAPLEYLTVKWYKGQLEVHNKTYNSDRKTPVNEYPILLISPSRADDGAQYRCAAVLDLGPEGPQPPPVVQSEPLSITVQYSPDILSQPHADGLIEGRDLHLNCTAVGNPVPTFKWNYTSANNVEVHTSGAVSVLTISTITKDNAGNYTCIATNSQGQSTMTFPVNVARGAAQALVAVGAVGGVFLCIFLVGLGFCFYSKMK
ncbi:hemicentin-1-like [Megalops cyprinoides]|uniref:hemicentin-1-like n=1 Tax=Megalops cyprinoides TaxID=118141 RepID=UPI0018647D2C|nr:hemicentin-1-like [Megalops cyprinoides]